MGMGMGNNTERILTVYICHESKEIDGTLYHTWLNLDEWPPGLYINCARYAPVEWGRLVSAAFARWAEWEAASQPLLLPLSEPSLS
jgi:hypothetical protein